MEKYHDVFALPTGSPLARAHDHFILLLPGTAPVNVKPYQYPHFQKEDIEKSLQEIMFLGVVLKSFSGGYNHR